MRGINGQRGQHREHVFHKIFIKPFTVARGDIIRVQDIYFGVSQFITQLTPTFLLPGHQFITRHGNGFKLLRRVEAVLRLGFDLGAHLAFQARNTHHIKFIKVRSGN